MKLNAAVKTGLVELELHKLYPYPNNFFVPYYGKRLNDLAESVENNGIITPIAVRLKDEEHFVILSGHNRVLAANMTNLKKIPAVVFVNLTDEEAEMIVIESNLHQRSFADLSLFERTEMVYKYHNQLKKQGRKSDLLNEIDIQKQLGNTSRRICRRLSPAEKSGYKFQLCAGNVSRYLKIHELEEPLRKLISDKDFGIDAAVNLAFLKKEEQQHLKEILEDETSNYTLNMKNVSRLRVSSEKNSPDNPFPLSKESMIKILENEKEIKTAKPIKMDIDKSR